jgi:DNA topoisomerase I
MSRNLVIVESPAKAKTIEKFLGEGFVVESCFGHVRDLPKDGLSIDVEKGFEPTYEVSPDKKKVIKDLKSKAKNADLVYLASDDDREGEAISWHLMKALDLNDSNTRRIVFREITKKAILNAIEVPRNIDQDLVNAQQARRVLDRLVGYEISPILWRKIKTGLSAGRVQSVAVRLVVEREREILKFQSKSSFIVRAEFLLANGAGFSADLNKRFQSAEEAVEFLERCKDFGFKVSDVEKKPSKRSPAAPFTTSTLQQEASRKLGFSVAQTMTLAQRLYESGHITYMRTDSLNLSEEAISGAKNEISSQYGDEYSEERRFKTKSSSAQEAHEAIRPTNFSTRKAGDDDGQSRLYELVWKRAIASQMSDARLQKTLVKIPAPGDEFHFEAKGEVIEFDGFLKVYVEGSDEDSDERTPGEERLLPFLAVDDDLDLREIYSRERFTKPSARYTEASLVRKLEEMGIGRPSTYAPTISTIQKRDYVRKESREGKIREFQEIKLQNGIVTRGTNQETAGTEKSKLFPTNTAMVVNDFLVSQFAGVLDYSFTANVEKEFDEIAEGKKEWNKMIGNFYTDFHQDVETTQAKEKKDLNLNRILGTDPKSGKNVIARIGRFGPMIQIGNVEDEDEKPRFASMRDGQYIETISLEEAMDLFKLPRDLGEWNGFMIQANIGRFGPYVRWDKLFASIPKDLDPYDIELDRAIELVKAKKIEADNRLIKEFDENKDITVLNGRYGPYIKAGKKNVKIPKDIEPKDLTLEQCLDLAEKAPEKKRFRKKK